MLNISFIGAGKAASSIAKAFWSANYNISVAVSRKLYSAKELAAQYENCKYSTVLSDALTSDLIIISANDDQIKIVAEAIADLNLDLTGRIFIHLSGAHNIEILKPLKEKGAVTASIHVMQTFPSKRPVEIKGAPAAVEAGDSDFPAILEIAESIGLKPFRISSAGKVFYHLAGVFASNMLVSEYSNAENMFAAAWCGDISPKQLLQPIMQRTLNNLTSKGTAASLSGPVERGDLPTIEKHIEALEDNKLSRLIYISGSLNLLEISFKKGSIDREKYESIQNYLKTGLKKCISEF